MEAPVGPDLIVIPVAVEPLELIIIAFFFFCFDDWSNCINTKTKSVGAKTKLNSGNVMTYLFVLGTPAVCRELSLNR